MLLVKLIRLENQFGSFDLMKAGVFQGAGWARIGGRGLRPLASQWCFSDESHIHVPQFEGVKYGHGADSARLHLPDIAFMHFAT